MLGLMASLSMLIPVFLFSHNDRTSIVHLITLKRQKTGIADNVLLILFNLGACITISFAVSVIASLMPFLGGSNAAEYKGSDPFTVTVMLTVYAVVPAIIEEVTFRGYIMEKLRPFGKGYAVLLSAVFFGMMHQTFSTVIFAFLSGMVFAAVRSVSGSLIPAMIAHCLNNTFSVIGTVCSRSIPEQTYIMAFYITTIVMFFVMIISITMLHFRGIYLFSLRHDEYEADNNEKTDSYKSAENELNESDNDESGPEQVKLRISDKIRITVISLPFLVFLLVTILMKIV